MQTTTLRLAFLLSALLTACASQSSDVGTTGGAPAAGPGGDLPGNEPAAKCVAVGEAKVLVQVDGLEVNTLAVDGENLWFGAREFDGSSPGVSAIYKVHVGGGEPETVVTDGYVGGGIGVHGNRLVYIQGKTTEDGMGWTYEYLNVLLRDKASGKVEKLDNPRTASSVSNLLVDPSGVYWGSREESARAPASISRWDPTTGKTTELTTVQNATNLLTDGKELFYERFDGDDVRFEAVPTGGGAPRVVKQPDHSSWRWDLVSVDDTTVYFLKRAVDAGTIGAGDLMAMSKDGSNERVLVRGRGFTSGLRADATHLYWNEQDEQDTLRRVSKKGGEPEVVWSEPNRWILDVTTDRCNVYWAVSNPPAVYAKSR